MTLAFSPVRTVEPAEAPVTLAEIKAHCREDTDDQDATLNIYINAAVSHIEGILDRALVTQSWRQDIAAFACTRLAIAPVASITSITYYDSDNAEQTLSTDVYALRKDALGWYVGLKPGQTWPSSYTRDDAVSITYVSGQDPDDIASDIKLAIFILVGHWNENREAVSELSMSEVPMSFESLVAKYRRVNL